MSDASLRVTLDLQTEVPTLDLPSDLAERLAAIATATLRRVHLDGDYEISLVLTGDRQIHRQNRRHRGIDKPTDVLSFPQQMAPMLDLPPDQAWAEREVGDDTHRSSDIPQMGASRDAISPSLVLIDESAMPGEMTHLGDIMISIPTVVRQAAEAGHSAWWELSFLVAHGVLHLVGYDDYYEPGYVAMVAHQEAVLTEQGISRR